MLRIAIFLTLLGACAERRDVPAWTPAAVVQVSIESDHPHVRLEEGTIQEEGVSNGGVAGVRRRETWRPVCLEPCDASLPAHRIYRLAADDVVATDSFVLDQSSSVKLRGKMGTAGERSAATVLIAIGGAQLVVAGAMMFGASTMGQDNSFVSTRDVLFLTAAILAGASLLGLIPGAVMWHHSSSKVEILSLQ